jgi:tetratricopeptide (TPR) repeat protein
MRHSLLLVLATILATTASADVAPAQLDAARALFKEGKRPLEAQKAFEAIAATDPKNAEAQWTLGMLALRRNEPERAVTYLESATSLDPENAQYYNTLGDAYGTSAQKAGVLSKFGLARKCLAAYERASALAPDNVNFRLSLFEYYRQAPGFVGGGRDKAVAQADAIKRLDPARGRLAFATLYTAERQYDKALAEFDEVLKTAPDDYQALYQVGRLAATSGQFLDRGLASLRRCLELPSPPAAPSHAAAQWRVGNILEKKGDPAGARAAYEAALKLDPKFTQAAEALKKLR